MCKLLFVCMAALVVACGPSSAEIKTAKTAMYKGDPQQIFALAQQVAAETYKIGGSDPEALTFVTRPQWYSSEGGRQSAGAGDVVQILPGSVEVAFFVQIEPMDSVMVVHVTPKTFQYLDGSPKPRELAPDDPNLPPWVLGRVDALHLAIYERAKPYVAQ